MADLGKIDERVIRAEFPVWLARDLLFNNPPGQNHKRYEMHTMAKKVKYTNKMLDYLYKMEASSHFYDPKFGRAVAIELDGMIRFVWRADLLTEEAYENVKKQRIGKLKDLVKK